jgi:hypothetical protein
MSVGKPEGELSLGISRRRWEDNIKMDVECIHLVEDADQWRTLVNTPLMIGLHKRKVISRSTQQLSASQENVSSTEIFKLLEN